ncbi:MAG: RluA family pseudouridine synthase [Lachnospiraceae bacterium]|nr:RluA family pseudouridine synthase [Lachnospiraceae bacterium]
MKLKILFEDEYILACVKPFGVPSQGDRSNDEDMVTAVTNYLFDHSDSDEEPYVAIIHRLDRPVGGVMLFAKTPSVAAKLSDMLQDGRIKKYYEAIISGELPDMEGTLMDYLVRNGRNNTTVVAKKGDKGAKKAVLNYEVIDVFETNLGVLSYVLIELETGRHHQIRVQLASRGCGIWGDTKYNPQFAKTKRRYLEMGLYSTRMEFVHPVTGEDIVLKSLPQGEAFDLIEMDEFE